MNSEANRLPIAVTAGDEGYLPLLQSCVDSLVEARQSLAFQIGVIDLGLSPESRAAISAKADFFVPASWPFATRPDFAAGAFALASVAKAALPDYFPGHPVYMWIDCDAFVQGPLGVSWFFNAALNGGTAMVQSIDRAYVMQADDHAWVRDRYAMAYPDDIATKLASRPYINSGVFAASASSKLWSLFKQRYLDALSAWSGPRLSDQAILNYIAVIDRLPYHNLPSSCNWICHLARPHLDQVNKLFTEAAFPYRHLQIVHNTHREKLILRPVKQFDGKVRKMRLTYHDLKSIEAL
ncbi:MAG TPA: hypothetical protein DCL54_12125 [Alphaproteobacteria bacterium]|nr:hypothetical protein [Alphaproteobacteria bacterium]HAJ47315.1 hypothetical protein [Alphaproteobacteria bacterium]